MKITNIIKGFEEFYLQNASPSLTDWGNPQPVSFKETGLFKRLNAFRDYGLNQEYALETLSIDGKGKPIAPESLKESVERLYSFWQKCLMFGGKSKDISENQIEASNFILTLQSRVRIDFGLNFAVDEPDDGKSYYTYSDVYHLAGGSRGHLKNKASELRIRAKPLEKGHIFSEINALVNHKELSSFYINVPKDIDNGATFSHVDTMWLLSTLKRYKPTRFSCIQNGKETIPDIHDYKRCGNQIISLIKKLPRVSGENTLSNMLGVDSSFIADIKHDESIKLTFPLLVKLDWAFFSLIHESKPYKPFQMITP